VVHVDNSGDDNGKLTNSGQFSSLSGRNPHAARQSDAMQNQHYKAIRNILFMWSKLNPGISYVQGMNEVLGPIYYVFATDTDENFKLHAEADAFFLFYSNYV